MKILDREGRLFGKISIIDVLVFAVVLLLAAALYVKNTRTETSNLITEQTITFQVMAQGLDDYIANAVREGDQLYDSDYSSGGRSLGEITDVQVVQEPGRRLAQNLPGGEAAYIDAEETVDLLITVKGTGVCSNGTYSLNRVYALGVNSSRTYHTKHVEFAGTVLEVS